MGPRRTERPGGGALNLTGRGLITARCSFGRLGRVPVRRTALLKSQWETLRTRNVIERLHEEFRRRVKTQGSLPTEDAALVLLFGLMASGQIRWRRLDGWRQIPAVLRERCRPAA
jgi:hypothetical protein